MARKMKTMDGNQAAAHVSYAYTEVAAIYPITCLLYTSSEGFVEESESYGLTNVNERLKLFFGAACRMKVESEEGAGMKVLIEIREERMHV